MEIYVVTQLVTPISRICMHRSIVWDNMNGPPWFVPTVPTIFLGNSEYFWETNYASTILSLVSKYTKYV